MALKNVGTVYQELEEWDRAAQAWRRITEQFPEGEGVVEIFFNLGFCYSQSGRHDMAYEVYSRIPGIAENEEQQGRAHYWSGISLKSLDRCEEAVRAFLRVPYLRTGGMWGVTAKLEAASCYEEIGLVDQALEIYRDIISSHGEGSDWGAVARKSIDRIEGGGKQRGNAPGTGGGRPDGDTGNREGGS
jgi:tetratricopeptide (TPR) repeat protein